MTEDAQWFLDRYAAELPQRIHTRETAADGDPEHHAAFVAYIDDGWNSRPRTTRSDDLVSCTHPTIRDKNAHCPVCDGSGYRQRVGERYVRPMKLTLIRLSRVYVPRDRPRLDILLRCLAANGGDYGLTAQALRPRYSFMWDRARAAGLIDWALRECRAAYREEPGTHISGKSEAQLDAEVAA